VIHQHLHLGDAAGVDVGAYSHRISHVLAPLEPLASIVAARLPLVFPYQFPPKVAWLRHRFSGSPSGER
jgi:hypothetical protein